MKEKITIRLAKKEDKEHLIQWLMEPHVLNWFPMDNIREVEDSVRLWLSYIPQKAVFIAEVDGKPVGSANLYLQPFEKLSHHSLFAIIVTTSMRGKGVGTALLKELIYQAKEVFHLMFLHLEVYEDNPAKKLYEKLGFSEVGKQPFFIKKEGKYYTKIFMEKYV